MVEAGSDSSPKERFLHHTAGGNGSGGSSYIDQVVLRERDANTNWHASSDGTLEERLYYCQNWRHDVVALVTSAGALRERVRYSSYGVPFGIPLGDCDSDGDVDSADQSILLGAWGTSSPKCDLDLSGAIDATDQSVQLGNSGSTGGLGELTRNRNRLGFSGYSIEPSAVPQWDARRRRFFTDSGYFVQRDLAGFTSGPSLFEYANDRPLAAVDPTGLVPFFVWIPTSFDLAPCGGIDCRADWQLTLPVASPQEDYKIVGLVSFSITAQCCDSGHPGFSFSFFEDWGNAADGMIASGTHTLRNPGRPKSTMTGTYHGEVLEVRLLKISDITAGVVGLDAQFDFDQRTIDFAICDVVTELAANPFSLKRPTGWTKGVVLSSGGHSASSAWHSCCADCGAPEGWGGAGECQNTSGTCVPSKGPASCGSALPPPPG